MKTKLLILLILVSSNIYASELDTVSIFSNTMQKPIKCVVITPSQVSAGAELPVVYMLHGYSGNHATWASEPFATQALADQYSVIVVCPDGNYNSWYWDSPINSKSKYETFVSSELVEYIDNNYPTIKSREGRAITGLSMGGQGALYLAFRHQDIFGAAGSMSGGVDIRQFPNNWSIKDLLGDPDTHPENWEEYTVMNQLQYLKPNSLALIIDCGTDDFFYDVNENLHKELLNRNIAHKYTTDQGAHEINYWKESLLYHMLFFSEFFRGR